MWSTKYWNITAGVSDRYDITEEDTRYVEDKDCVENDGYGGFDIDVYRYFRRAGSDELVRKETMHDDALRHRDLRQGPERLTVPRRGGNLAVGVLVCPLRYPCGRGVELRRAC